jgi:hypothetical protein
MEDVSEWRLSTSAGIPYKLVVSEGEFSYEDATITEEYIIRSVDLLAFVTNAFPEPVEFMGTLRYAQQPVIRGLGTLTPRKVRYKGLTEGKPIDPFAGDPLANIRTYEPFLTVIVDYGPTPPNDQEQDPNNPRTFLDISTNASGVFLNSPQEGKAEWELPSWVDECVKDEDGNIESGECTDVETPNIPKTVTETEVEWSIKWPAIPYTFWDGKLMSRLRDKLGKVNEGAMATLHNAVAETVLFMSYSASVQYTWRQGRTGMSPINLEMNFLEKSFTAKEGANEVQVTHQHFWRPNFGWRKLKINGEYSYQTTDLDAIWSPS